MSPVCAVSVSGEGNSSVPKEMILKKGKQKKIVSMRVLCDTIGVVRQTVYDWLRQDKYGIVDYCVLVKVNRCGDGVAKGVVRPYKDASQSGRVRSEKYYFYDEFLSVFAERSNRGIFPAYSLSRIGIDKGWKTTPEETVSLYFELLVIIEKRLDEEQLSIATEKQAWLDMKLVDVEIVGHIFYWYEQSFGEALQQNGKAAIRNAIEHHFFDNESIRNVCHLGMKDMLSVLKEEEQQKEEGEK